VSDIERGKALLGILRDIAKATRETITRESPSILDRAAILARLFLPLRLFIENPSCRALAKIAGARRLSSMAYFKAQQEWFEAGKNDAVQRVDPQLAADIDAAYTSVIEAIRDAMGVENAWAKLPENIVDQAVSEFFSGLLDTLERWGKFAAAPFGIPWDMILLGLGVLLVVVLVRKAK